MRRRQALASLVFCHFRAGGILAMPLGALGVRNDESLEILFEPDEDMPYLDATVGDAIEYLLFTWSHGKNKREDAA
ncbi:MAG: hypothetical protein HRF49_00015 [bacterium]|jgi:hypothetical protein